MRPDWFDHAACRGLNPNLMVPERGDNISVRTAKQICSTCPVLDECRDYGLAVHRQADLDGVFGGLTKIERLRILRTENLPRRRQTPINRMNFRIDDHLLRPCGTVSAYHRHLSRKERPCELCKKANAENQREYRLRKPRPSRAKSDAA